MEIFKKRYAYVDEYDELIEKITLAWSWESIDKGTNSSDYYYTSFSIGRMRLILVKGSNIIVNVSFDGNEDNYIGGVNAILLWFTYVKNSNALIMHFQGSSNYNDTPYYRFGFTLAIGSATNMITKSKENVMSIITDSYVNQSSENYNKLFIPSNDIITYEALTSGNVKYNSDVALTIISNVSQMKSQVVMDDVYIVNRCNLTEPSIGECTLNGKKYFMFNHIWLSYD